MFVLVWWNLMTNSIHQNTMSVLEYLGLIVFVLLLTGTIPWKNRNSTRSKGEVLAAIPASSTTRQPRHASQAAKPSSPPGLLHLFLFHFYFHYKILNIHSTVQFSILNRIGWCSTATKSQHCHISTTKSDPFAVNSTGANVNWL